jgi:formylglycine-generating enzyme required for sulfatase activity
MGCTASVQSICESDEFPIHVTELRSSFYVGRYEVSQREWAARMGANGSAFPDSAEEATRPVERVSWFAANSFARSLGLRLPTEAEWEYAARGAEEFAFPSHSDDEGSVSGFAWFSSNSGGKTRSVGSRAPNGFGLFDMAGNVREFVADWFGTYLAGAQVAPEGPVIGTSKISRGGSWGDPAAKLRCSDRVAVSPGLQSDLCGFRVVRDP